MTIRILTGDCRDVMRGMEVESVDCIVTSPPYWGLRDYGVPGQLGLEPTLGEHIATMVDVFECARRVLKKTGTLWLNYGSCYAAQVNGRSAHDVKLKGNDDRTFRDKPFSTVSRGKPAIQSHLPERVPAYGSDGTARLDWRDPGSACSDLCDECLSDFLSHHGRTSHNGQPLSLDAPPAATTVHDNGHSDSERAVPPVSPRDVPLSTMLESWRQLRGPCLRCDSRASGLSAVRSSSGGAQGSVHSSWLNYSAMWFKPKDLITVPNILALALQQAGWWLRSEIIWSKPNPMPESVRDRPTSAHEKIWLLTKSDRYFYDAEAIAEEAIGDPGGDIKPTKGAGDPFMRTRNGLHLAQEKARQNGGFDTRNRRNVWTIPSQPFSDAHFATFPPALIEPCILAGCPKGGTVLDPFGGSGTTGMVADRLGRNAILIELNQKYAAMAQARIVNDLPLFAEVTG